MKALIADDESVVMDGCRLVEMADISAMLAAALRADPGLNLVIEPMANAHYKGCGKVIYAAQRAGVPMENVRYTTEQGEVVSFQQLGAQAADGLDRAASPHFRQAEVGDIPAMSAIRLAVRENVLSHPGRITPQMYRDYLARLGRGWVAELDGEIAGFSYADQTDGSIWALFIAPVHEGKGLGRALLQLATDWLFAQGHECVRLSTGAGTRAERFYAEQGWRREKEVNGDVHYCLLAKAQQGDQVPSLL